MREIYMDHSATTPVDGAVLETMLPYFREKFGNASSIHQFGQEARNVVEEARERVAGFIGAKSSEITFLSGGSEADNFALQGLTSAYSGRGKHIITTSIEHPAIIETANYLEQNGISVTYLQPDKYGLIHPHQVEDAIRPETFLISVMHVNNELGTMNPIGEIGAIAQNHGILFHTDAVQAFGKLPIDVVAMNIDLLSASSHKIYGPKGVGILFIKEGTQIDKLIHGAAHERNRRAGTENVAGIVGFDKAVEICENVMTEEAARLTVLREYFWNKIETSIPDVIQNGHPTEKIPGILNMSFKGVEGESLLISLDMKGIAASSGSACSSGSNKPSHVLQSIRLAPELLNGTLRFSLGRSNTEDDIDYTVDALSEIVERLRAMAPVS
ncbi:MAG TPA: cysteine desulfurase [Bacteroidetes bacterium]|nr:cysteine desulfurase [Bacteroidota bacterium]